MKTHSKVLLTLFIFIGMSLQLSAQLAAGKSKFLGNIVGSSVPGSFSTYWNQVTPENAGKWGSVESTRDVMSWSQLDVAYNYAVNNGYKFKLHTLVWGAQYPSWITSLSQADQRAEIEEWMSALANRYPNIWAIDVVNEPVKTACPFKSALGGDGSTGWDWVITSFQLARQYFPNAKLLINEYGTENDASARSTYLTIINLLNTRGLIDGIGIQCHYFNLDYMTAAQMTTCLNAYAATGLDIYVSELDIRGISGSVSESDQNTKYQQLFPVMWEHSSVKGITLWGYIEGQTWQSGTGIVRSDGTEKPAMTWLKSYMGGGGGGTGGNNSITVRARGTSGAESISLTVGSTVIATWTVTTSYQDYTATTSNTGGILVSFTNDASGRDVQCDYIVVNGTYLQAENQSYNTAVYQNGACGGSYSEWMHCNGAIGFSGSNLNKDTVEPEDQIVDKGYALYQNYPNPFNPTTIIEYDLAEAGYVKLTITDVVGREIKTLVRGNNDAGTHSIVFNAEGIPSGVYFYTLEAGANIITKKMVLLK